MKVIDDAVYMEASDYHGIKTAYFLRRAGKKLVRMLFGVFFQGALIVAGMFVAFRVIGAHML